jgi:MFS family permease
VLVFCSAETFSMAGFALVPSLLPQLSRQWSLSATEGGWLGGIFFLGYILAVPVLVSLTDRIDARRIYLASAALSGLALAGFAGLADSFATALGWWWLAGLGLAGTYMPGLKALTDRLPVAAQSRGTAFYTATFGVGAGLSYLWIGLSQVLLPWRWLFALAAGYLRFDETDSSAALQDGRRNTLGARLAGKQPVKDGKTLVGTWNWDVEGAWQFGEDNFGSAAYRDVQAGMVGALGGYTFDDVTWKPGLGGIFYWGSGDSDPTTGDINTFNSLYPLGHAYWGQIDNFSGQNLLDYGVQASIKPHEKLSVVSQWHYFDLAQSSDRIYNIAGAGLAGSGDKNVGNELDFVGTYTHSKSFNVQLGYLMFFYGDAVNNGGLARSDAEQFYLQGTYSF